jgi:predicted choloylglycine hydrolase
MIKTTTLVGSRQEIGQIQGTRIQELRLPTTSAAHRSFSETCRTIVEKRHPAMIEEFMGMLEASNLPEVDFTSYYFGRTAPAAGGCTNLAVIAEASAQNETIVGRNYDWAYSDQRWCEARRFAPFGEPQRLGYTHHWGGLCDGMNEYGLTICIASLPSLADAEPGLQWHIVVDLVLATCKSAEEAAALLSEIPHVRSLAYLVADLTTARLIEASPGKVDIHSPENGLLVGTNHRIEGTPSGSLRESASVRRRNGALDRLKPHVGRLTEEHISHVLTDHDSGVCAGVHENINEPYSGDEASGTIWSLIAYPARTLVEVAPGHPCVTAYERLQWTS